MDALAAHDEKDQKCEGVPFDIRITTDCDTVHLRGVSECGSSLDLDLNLHCPGEPSTKSTTTEADSQKLFLAVGVSADRWNGQVTEHGIALDFQARYHTFTLLKKQQVYLFGGVQITPNATAYAANDRPHKDSELYDVVDSLGRPLVWGRDGSERLRC